MVTSQKREQPWELKQIQPVAAAQMNKTPASVGSCLWCFATNRQRLGSLWTAMAGLMWTHCSRESAALDAELTKRSWIELSTLMPNFIDSILREGIVSKQRLYVHLSTDVDTATKVGSRHGDPVVLVVDAARMLTDGHKFWLSENGVWQCETVPVGYFHTFQPSA